MGIVAVFRRLRFGWSGRAVLACLVSLTVVAGLTAVATAAPASRATGGLSRAQNVGWLSPEAAAQLDVGIDVMVPTAVPSPFGGEPAIQASDGFYSLYWWIPGEPPTFLQITGTAGGSLPAGSPYDLNIQLEVNAAVQGYPAIHDVTPIYDNVWWQAGKVVYMVSSRNLTETDSLSLANALIPLAVPPPAEPDAGDPNEEPVEEAPAEEPEPAPTLIVPEVVEASEVATITVQGVDSATLVADAGVFVDTGSATYRDVGSWAILWEAPDVQEDTSIGFALLDPNDGSVLAAAEIAVAGNPVASATELPGDEEEPAEGSESGEEALATDATTSGAETTADSEPSGELAPEDIEDPVVADGTGGVVETAPDGPLPTDGTDGPTPPVFGTDGTGGVNHVVIPTNVQAEE